MRVLPCFKGTHLQALLIAMSYTRNNKVYARELCSTTEKSALSIGRICLVWVEATR